MLDMVKAIRFPTAEEAIALMGMCNTDGKDIMCTCEGANHYVLTKKDGEPVCEQISHDMVHCNAVFYPVFEIDPDVKVLFGEHKYPKMARFAEEHTVNRCRFVAHEPTPTNGIGAVRLGPTTYISSVRALQFASWGRAETVCHRVPRFEYLFCPYCAAFHRMPSYSDPKTLVTVLRCNRCGREFIASRADKVGCKVQSYSYPTGLDFTYVDSMAIPVPMHNGKSADAIVLGWPAGVRVITQVDLCSVYSGPAQSMAQVMHDLFGNGWDSIDLNLLREQMRSEWGVEDFTSFEDFTRDRLSW